MGDKKDKRTFKTLEKFLFLSTKYQKGVTTEAKHFRKANNNKLLFKTNNSYNNNNNKAIKKKAKRHKNEMKS